MHLLSFRSFLVFGVLETFLLGTLTVVGTIPAWGWFSASAVLFFGVFAWDRWIQPWTSRVPSLQVALLVGIVGTWFFISVALATGALLIWNHRPEASASDQRGDGPIRWNQGFSIDGDLTSKIGALRFLGVNISKEQAIHLKEANILSAIDGSLVPLEVVAVDEKGENQIVPLSKIGLVPPGARIELLARFGGKDPANPKYVLGVEPKAFLDKWRQFSFNVTDDTRSYRMDYNDSHMMVFFQGKVGPRIAIKSE